MTPAQVGALVERFAAGGPCVVRISRPVIELPPRGGFKEYAQGRRLTVTVDRSA